MRKFLLYLLFIPLSIFSKEIMRPSFLLENEPFPPGVTFQYGVSSNSEGYSDYLIDITPISLGSSDKLLFFGNMGVMGEEYSSSLKEVDHYQGYYGGFLLTGRFNQQWHWYTWSWLRATLSYVTQSTFTNIEDGEEITTIKDHMRVKVAYILRP